jgi:hypothetical protein
MTQHITILADASDEGRGKKYVFLSLADMLILLSVDAWPPSLVPEIRPCLEADEQVSEIIIDDGEVTSFQDDTESWQKHLRMIRRVADDQLESTGGNYQEEND